MKLLLILIFNISLSNVNWGQKTYCKLFDLDPESPFNVPNDMKVLGNKIVIGSTTLCDYITEYSDCSKLATFNLDGIKLDATVIDSFSTYSRNECISFLDSNLIVSGNMYPISNTCDILTYDMDLNLISKFKLTGPPDMYYTNYGYLIKDEIIYFNGILLPKNGSKSTTEARIVKMKVKTKEIIWEKSFTLGNFNLVCNDLQSTPDGNLAFILYFSPPAGIGPDPAFKILKINPDGEVLDSFQFFDYKEHGNRLLVSKENSYYFSSVDHPTKGWDFKNTGRINKLNSSMDELDWNIVLPNNPYTDGRRYSIQDYIEAKNGDIVAIGNVKENSDSKIFGGDISTTYNGFIVRLNSEGNLVWLRIYRMPQELLDISIYGQFRESSLNKIVELESGDFIACGDVYYNNLQNSAIDPTKNEIDHLWLIRVDSSGCLDDYPCDTIIRIRPSIPFDSHQFNIGDQWTFETVEPSGNPWEPYIRFTNRQIMDTLNSNGKKIYVFYNQDSMYQENGKMFFWDAYLKSFEMYYDFKSTSEYEIKYYDISRKNVQIAKVSVDSVYNTIINSDTIPTQILHIANNGSFPDDANFIVYKNIGASEYEIRLHLGYGLQDPVRLVTKLRCFKSINKVINFQSYPCDSTWQYTNTTNLGDNKLSIVPNPTLDIIQILGIEKDLPFELFNTQGEKVSNGTTINGKIYIPNTGVFILKVKFENGYSINRILRL